jgi:hypothetical protein
MVIVWTDPVLGTSISITAPGPEYPDEKAGQ